MVVKTGHEKEEEPKIEVEKGAVIKTIEYKYLGQYLTEDGTIEKQLSYVDSKAGGMIAELSRVANEAKVGHLSSQIQLMLYEATIIPAVTYNLETWS